MKSFYIGKSHIRKGVLRKFNPEHPSTWRLADGIDSRYKEHVKESYGRSGLIVVAVITRDSIPEDCIASGHITHQEGYALTLETRLIEKFQEDEDERLANKSIDFGHTDGAKSIAYVVYVAYTLE